MTNISRLQVIITFTKPLSLLIYQSRWEISELHLKLKAVFSVSCTEITNSQCKNFNGVCLPTTGTYTQPLLMSPLLNKILLYFLVTVRFDPIQKKRKKKEWQKRGKKQREKKKKLTLAKRLKLWELRKYWPRKKKISWGRPVVHSNAIGCLVREATWSAKSETRALFLKQNKAGILSNDCKSPVPSDSGR